MRFKRSTEPTIAEPATPDQPADVQLLEMIGILAAGRAAAELRAERAEAALAAAIERLAELGHLDDELADVKSKVTEAVTLGVNLLGQGARSEQEASLLAQAMVLAEFPETATEADDHD